MSTIQLDLVQDGGDGIVTIILSPGAHPGWLTAKVLVRVDGARVDVCCGVEVSDVSKLRRDLETLSSAKIRFCPVEQQFGFVLHLTRDQVYTWGHVRSRSGSFVIDWELPIGRAGLKRLSRQLASVSETS